MWLKTNNYAIYLLSAYSKIHLELKINKLLRSQKKKM